MNNNNKMGIYYVKSTTCDCRSSWSTLNPKNRSIHMTNTCTSHKIEKGNIIYYNLQPIIQYLLCKDKCTNTQHK